MNRTTTALAALLLPLMAASQSNSERLHLSNMSVNKGDSLITLNMTLHPKEYRLKGNDIVSLTPMLVADGDTLWMPPVKVAGRNAWYSQIREGAATEATLSRAGKGIPVDYSYTLPIDKEFAMSTIVIQADTVSICNCEPPKTGFTNIVELPEPPETHILEMIHNFEYIPVAASGSKTYDLSGRANIIFKLNKTDIDWTYFSNHAELDTIMKTIDAVKDNQYATVERILLTGYASPEGPYKNNVRLAKGRTEEVLKYVKSKSDFAPDVYKSNSVPEDWEGLRAWLEESPLPNRDAMIAFIDDRSIPIERKNDLFAAKFPNDYKFLLDNVYPMLRHTDYRITYSIKKFYDVDEIEKVFETNPRLLTINELYLLANKYEPGSDAYYQVFKAAAVMNPDNEIANLNAAGCAMSNDNFQDARTFLAKAGHGPEADYAWGMLYAMEQEYDKALEYLEKARAAGLKKADEAIREVETAKQPFEPVILH